MARKKSNRIPLPILVLIYACLLYAMYVSLSTIALALWGESVMGTVDSYDSRRDDSTAEANRSRTISKGYHFTVNGKAYRGYVIYRSDEQWPGLSEGETRSERISYFSFFPYINKPAALADFSLMGEAAIIYHILAPVGCFLLLLLVTGTLKRGKKAKRAVRKGAAVQNKDARGDAIMSCPNCGNNLPEGSSFCPFCGAEVQQGNADICRFCGAAIPRDAAFCTNCGAAANKGEAWPAQVKSHVPQSSGHAQRTGLVGFSEHCSNPEILEAARKNRKFSIGCMWVLVFVPLIGFPVAGLLMDDFPFREAVIVGVGIAAVMLIINFFYLLGAKRPMWEGAVVNKYSKVRSEHRGGEDGNYRTYTEYTTVINTDAGKKRTIREKDSQRHMYDYLAVGDRVRFHPMFGTYEKYDKSKDRIIYCNICSMMNPIQNDRCKRCGNLLFK